MFALRARSCHPNARFLQCENLELTAEVYELQARLIDVKAFNELLAAQVERLTPRRRQPINAKQLADTIKSLATAKECATLVNPTNGPTVFWLTVKRLGVQRPHADMVSAEAQGDWSKAVARLEDYKF